MIGALAALSGAAAVLAGAFGAHGASGRAVEWLRTGAEYQLIHVAAALFAQGHPRGRGAALLFVAGGWLFAGSLYAMAFGAPRMLGMVTPFGGGALVLGWLVLAARLARKG